MNFNKAINGEPETISEIDETTKLKIKTAFGQGDKETLLELSSSNNISIAQYLSDYMSAKSVEIGKILKTSDRLEILNNLKNMSNIDKYPKFKEEIEEITKILADYLNDLKSPSEPNNIKFDHLYEGERDKSKIIAINEEYYELKLQQLFKNYSPENVETLKELSEMEDINFASAFFNVYYQNTGIDISYTDILPECFLNIYKLDVIENVPEIKKSIQELILNPRFSKTYPDIVEELLKFNNTKNQNEVSVDKTMEEIPNETPEEKELRLATAFNTLSSLMYQFVSAAFTSVGLDITKESIEKCIKECKDDPDLDTRLKLKLSEIEKYARINGLEKRFEDLKKFVNNTVEKEEIKSKSLDEEIAEKANEIIVEKVNETIAEKATNLSDVR